MPAPKPPPVDFLPPLRRLGLLEKALESTPCGVTLADARAPDVPLVYVNEGFRRMTGFDSQEALGQNCRFLQGEDRRQPAREAIREAIREGREVEVVLRNYRKGGERLWNELILAPIEDENGELAHFVGIQTDVTEREEAKRERLRLLADLRAINRELDDFAHIVSHDLQAPLRGIDQLARMLLARSEDRSNDDESTRMLGLLSVRARRLQALVRSLLEYSRVGRAALESTEVDLGETLDAVVGLLQPPPEIRVEKTTELPVIESDPVRTQQILQNLVGNAVRHMGGPGRVAVDCEKTPGGWRLRVEDDGPGIDPEHHERIFGIFSTVRSADEEDHTSGVGLTITKKAVEQLRGRIWLESEPGRGTTFFVELPEPSDTDEEE